MVISSLVLEANAFKTLISLKKCLLIPDNMINSATGSLLHTKHTSIFLKHLTTRIKDYIGLPVSRMVGQDMEIALGIE